MEIVPLEIERYAEGHTSAESELLAELISFSEANLEYTDMLSGRVVGRLLAMLVKISGARRILEIGTFTGYSAMTMAEALPEGGELVTLEYNERYEEIARSFFAKSDHGDKIRLKMGFAMDTLDELSGPFDFIFLDADKINYPGYYRKIKPMMSSGALMAVDNVLWSGTVIDPEDEKEMAIDRLNRMIHDDAEVEQVMLTIRDGLTIVRKK
ncbi:MAG: class I SAM-dependent methyltransferase [Balneolaceae bacterium]|nr:class I SAM-dependent methyltransferase [Balneolaceae bacterium]